MAKVYQFRRTPYRLFPKGFYPRRKRRLGFKAALVGCVAFGTAIGTLIGQPRTVIDVGMPAEEPRSVTAFAASAVQTLTATPTRGRFSLCHTGGGRNCVVDGDTAWIEGEKVRLADIDAPETHPPRCPREAELGNRATERLQALLNSGPVELTDNQPAADRYGRRLAIVTVNGASVGDALVEEGLARRWEGYRRPWCGNA